MKSASLFLLAALPLCAQVTITQHTDRISIDIDGKPFTEMIIGGGATKPYMYPLRAASGKIVSRAYPMDNIEGESKDHPHQRSMWFAHGDVNGFDFWGNEMSQHTDDGKRGTIVLKKVGLLKSGKKSGSLSATFDWVAAGKPLLTESRTVVFYSNPTLRIMDFDLNLKALEKAKFGDTKEGTFGIRLAASLEEPHPKSPTMPKRTGLMVSSTGGRGEKEVWGKRADWVDYAGEIDGEKLGIAILDNPANPKHPTYWHSRSYGLFAANIFGEHDYYNDKTRDGSVTIQPGESLHFRYRVIIHPGDAATANIAAMYKKYTEGK